MNKTILNDNTFFSGTGINAKEDQGVIKLEPFKANAEFFILREEGPFGIITTNNKLTINYGGEYTLEVESSEYKGHLVSLLDDQQDPVYQINANQCENGVKYDIGSGNIAFDNEGYKLELFIKDEEIGLEVTLHVEGFDEKRKFKYSELDGNNTFSIEMKSRSEMNLEEINKVEQQFLEKIRSGTRPANMGIGQNAVLGAITKSFDVFREHGLQVIKNDMPVIELKIR